MPFAGETSSLSSADLDEVEDHSVNPGIDARQVCKDRQQFWALEAIQSTCLPYSSAL